MNTADTIANAIINDPEMFRRVVSYDFSMYDEGEYGFVKEIAERNGLSTDEPREDVYYALRLVRANWRANF